MSEEASSNVPMTARKRTAKVLLTSSTFEGIAAGFAVAMTIVGLVGHYPEILVSVSIIVLGVALFFEGAAISAKFRELISSTTEAGRTEVRGGAATETLGGLFAIAMGILSVLGMVPATLVPASIILIGACMVLGSGTNIRMIALSISKPESSSVDRMARQAAYSATAFQVLIGFGAIALGILALSNISPLMLSLVAILAISGSILLSCSSLVGRLMSQLR